MSTSKFPLGLLIAVVMAAGFVGLFWSHTSAEETGLIHLAQGWNLVGWTGEKQSVSEALAPNRVYGLPDTVLAVYGYNNESQSFTRHIFGRPEISTLTDFEPEQAYWVLAQARTTWWVSDPAEPSCPTATPCPDCGQWQSLAEQCSASYDQCVTDFSDCVAVLTVCLATQPTDPDIDDVCGLIDDLVWDNQDLQSAWGFLLVKIMFDDDFGMIDWIGTDSAVSDIGWTASSLQSWATRNCR